MVTEILWIHLNWAKRLTEFENNVHTLTNDIYGIHNFIAAEKQRPLK